MATAAPECEVTIPEICGVLLDPPPGSVRYRVLYGGRGSGKSWSAARALLVLGMQAPLRILCTREHQTSIRDSVHRILKDQVETLGLDGFYEVGQSEIKGANGTLFLFKGLRFNVSEIKSTEGVNICWVEEAENTSEESWRTLTPTIREEGSEIWVTFNPALPDDPTYKRFVLNTPARALVRSVGYKDNPWLPEVLREEADALRLTDPETYDHVWGGQPWSRSDAIVLAGKVHIEDFMPQPGWQGPYYGADWGFSVDPTTLVRCWTGDRCLWVEYEADGVQMSTEDTARCFDTVPDSRSYVIRADSARPETVAAVKALGFRIEGVEKWSGSVKDGIQHLRSYDRIVLHPRCEQTQREARLWRYKTDPRTKDVLPVLLDGNDHRMDAIRYALAPLIQRREVGRIRMGYF